MTIKERVLLAIQHWKEFGGTTWEIIHALGELPQSVYPCLTQLCKEGEILDSLARRRSCKGRYTIVWVSKEYPGVIPVWKSSHVHYGYAGRAKVVMDLLSDYGPLSASEICTAATSYDQMSISSLLSRLREQEWVRTLPDKRKNANNQMCLLYALTPRGNQVRTQSSTCDRRECLTSPTIQKEKN